VQRDPAPRESRLWPLGGGLLRLSWGVGIDAKTLYWQRFGPDGAALAAETAVALPDRPNGTPALGGDYVLVPLTNGIVVRIPLGEGGVVSGPDWRGIGVEENAPGHVVQVGPDLFAVTDGSRELALIHWPDAKNWSKKAHTALAHRIATPPAPLTDATGRPRIAVADAAGTVTFFDRDSLQVVRRWTLAGQITAGPLPIGDGLVCVLNRRRIVWIDPALANPKWEYACAAELAGAPRLVDGRVVVADGSGQITWLDLAGGVPVGPGWMPRPQVAPAAAPAPVPDGRLAVLLTDGTIVLAPRP
jgi:hypothetical protein